MAECHFQKIQCASDRLREVRVAELTVPREGESFLLSVVFAECSDEHSKGHSERVGFEPTVEFPLHTFSKRAPSTARTFGALVVG
jgi:hypothetical protein